MATKTMTRKGRMDSGPVSGTGGRPASRPYSRNDRATMPEGCPLTPRQYDVLRLLAEGRSREEIGLLLGTSTRTVDTHMAAMLRKTRTHRQAALVVHAIREGWLPMPAGKRIAVQPLSYARELVLDDQQVAALWNLATRVAAVSGEGPGGHRKLTADCGGHVCWVCFVSEGARDLVRLIEGANG